MVTKRPHHTGKGARSDGDNFRAINGVSGIVESCLHRAGILTYAQFASLSSDDIITIVGNVSALSPERITKQNWIGQARELALRTSSNQTSNEAAGEAPNETFRETPEEATEDASEDAAQSGGERRGEKFVVELLLDHDRVVTHTCVTSTRTGDLEEWGGWREDRLVNFFARQADIREAKASANAETEVTTAKAAPDDKSIAKPVAEPDERSGSHKLEIWTSASNAPSNLARHDQPFDVRMNLDPAHLAVSSNEPLVYDVVFNARSIGDQQVRTCRRVNGKIEQPGNPSITIKGLYLQPGSYVLNASVIFGQPGKASAKSGAFRVQAESSFLYVY